MTAALAAGITACSDDHFDINSDVLGKATIWENIKSEPSLSQYADILQSVYYSSTEIKTTPETYADIFNSNQTFTVWAPVNDSFNYSYYKSLLAIGIRDSIYKVEKELIRNNMTRYSHVVNGSDSIKLELFNAKAAWLNNRSCTFKGQDITKSNIGASNGVLHITKAPAAYQPNLYEFLSSRSGQLDSINAFIKSFEKHQFDEFASTPGPTIDGKVTWVDSVTYVYNSYSSRTMGAQLASEDSNYVMIIPTNNAWRETLKKTKKYFHFKASYKQDVKTQTEAGADTTITGAETNFTEAELDSLNDYYAKSGIAKDLVFNANWQYRQIPVTSIADIKAADARKDSLLTASGMTYKKTGTLNITNPWDETLEVDNFADMFGNAEPIETSNGYAYIVDEFKYPSTVYAPNINADATMAVNSVDQQCAASTLRQTYVKPMLTVDGEVVASSDSTFSYTYLVMSNKNATSNPGAFFKIDDVLSCKYDIYVVIGYNTDYNLPNKFRAYIDYDTEDKRQSNFTLKNPNEDMLDAKGSELFGSNYFVNRPPHLNEKGEIDFTDTICIAKDFEFPVSYMGLKQAYPLIQLKSNITSSEKVYYCRELWVNAIIFKAKGHDE